MPSSVRCVACETENAEAKRVCRQCGASLRPALAQLYLDRTDDEVSLGHYDLASKYLIKADAEMLPLGADERDRLLLTARAFWLQGSIYYYKGLMYEAEQELLFAQQKLEQHTNSAELMALVLNRLGSVYYYENRLSEATAILRRSSQLAMEIGAYATASKAIGNLGVILTTTAPQEALTFYKQALGQAEASGDAGVLAQMYRLLARFHAGYGPYSLALDYADKGLAIATKLEDLYVRTLNLDVAASVHLRLGDTAQAVAYLREAYDLTRHTSNKITTEAVMLTLAELIRFDEYSVATFEQALKEFTETLGSALFKGRYALQMAYYYIRQADWVHVRRLMQQLDQIDTSTMAQGNPILISCAVALLHAALGEWDAATVQYELALGSGKLTRYDLALTWEDYASMLLDCNEVNPDPLIMQTACSALGQAASIYHELELPRRAAAVEGRLSLIY